MIIFDAEIKKCIPNRSEPRDMALQYCDGWRDFKNMGISVVCTFDLQSKLSRCFTDDNMGELNGYLKGQPTAAFNSKKFDNLLLKEHGVEIDEAQHFDVLDCIIQQTGTFSGWSLDSIMQGTMQVAKSGAGALAPVWYQQGQIGKVIDYCLRDVWLEARLVQWCLSGKVLYALNKQPLVINLPSWIPQSKGA